MEGEKLSELVLKRLLISENGRLVSQDGTHVSTECLHILGNEDFVLMGLVPEGIKAVSEGNTGSSRSGVRLDGAAPEVGWGGGG